MRIADILTKKERPGVVSIAPRETVRVLLEVLATNGIGACVVSPDGHRLAGIVSERDVVRRLQEDEDLLDRDVGSIMTAAVITCTPDATVSELMSLMTDHRIRHVPVVEPSPDGSGSTTVVGVVSIGDLVKNRIDELTFERDQLEKYVHQA